MLFIRISNLVMKFDDVPPILIEASLRRGSGFSREWYEYMDCVGVGTYRGGSRENGVEDIERGGVTGGGIGAG